MTVTDFNSLIFRRDPPPEGGFHRQDENADRRGGGFIQRFGLISRIQAGSFLKTRPQNSQLTLSLEQRNGM
jgi:hypothetical protein